MAVKMSVNLPDEAVENLREIAEKNGITLTAALRQAISNEKFLDEQLKDNSKLLIEDKDKSIRQVVFSK
jgi:predicted transcriptional regulator